MVASVQFQICPKDRGLSALPDSLSSLFARVEETIVPTARERGRMESLSTMLLERSQHAVDETGLEGIASLQGSVAKDTWLHDHADLDIFIQFPASVDRSEWTGRVLPILRKEFGKYRMLERYAEHPYLEFFADSEVRVNVVPCYNVEKGKWLSATDRTPFHKEWMNRKLNDVVRLQVRLLKRYCMGTGVYGAEIKTGGFSGMLVETLTVYYKTFLDVLRMASGWKEGTVVDVENYYQSRDGTVRKKFDDAPLIVIDPVDPDRNLAAALRPERLWSFVASAREFLEAPDWRFFYPPNPRLRTIPELKKRLTRPGTDILGLAFKHDEMIPDILWGQLYRLERTLTELMDRYEFQVMRSRAWSDEKKQSVILYELEQAVLSETQVRQGPPVERAQESRSFIEKYAGAQETVRGPWLDGDRWMVEKRRAIRSMDQLLKRILADGTMNVSLPSQLEKGLHKTAHLLVREKLLQLARQHEFNVVLAEFLEGRPRWMNAKAY